MTTFLLNQITSSYNIKFLCYIFRRINPHLQATNETDKMIQSILFKQIFQAIILNKLAFKIFKNLPNFIKLFKNVLIKLKFFKFKF